MQCPKCGYKIKKEAIAKELGRLGGSKTSEAKTIAARENGKKAHKNKASTHISSQK